MAVPKKKTSKAKSRSRRASAWTLDEPARSVCPRCADGNACSADTDCTSQVCAVTCQAPTCLDGLQNGDETDVDCGGSSCAPCGTGQLCIVDTDCTSAICAGNLCE